MYETARTALQSAQTGVCSHAAMPMCGASVVCPRACGHDFHIADDDEGGTNLVNIRFDSKIQDEHKRTLHFQSDTENKYGVLRTSHLHQSI
jgi:hypothetical protein